MLVNSVPSYFECFLTYDSLICHLLIVKDLSNSSDHKISNRFAHLYNAHHIAD